MKKWKMHENEESVFNYAKGFFCGRCVKVMKGIVELDDDKTPFYDQDESVKSF